MRRIIKNNIFALVAMFCGLFAISCQSDLPEIKDYADSDYLLKEFAISYGTKQYYAAIDQESGTLALSNIAYSALISSVRVTLAEGATIYPDPTTFSDWTTTNVFTVTMGEEVKQYTLTLNDYADLVDFKSVGYITSAYWLYDSVIETIDWSNLSHVILSFLQVNTDGSYTETSNLSSRLTDLQTKAANNDFKLMIAVQSSATNGNTSGNFYTCINNETTRATLIENLVNYVKVKGLDGIDIDFEEYSRVNSAAYDTFLKELKTAIVELEESEGRDVIYSVAVAPNISGYPTDLGSTVDFINLMIYDISSSYTNAQHASMTHFKTYMSSTYAARYGATARQLIGGLPFYGYTYDANGSNSTTTSSGTQTAYSEIFPAYITKGYTPLQIADADQVGNTVYNGRPTLAEKCQYVVENSYGGVMIWQIGQDLYQSDYEDYRLLPVIGENIEFIEGKPII